MPTQKDFDRLHRQWTYDTDVAARELDHCRWWQDMAARYLSRCRYNPLAAPLFSFGAPASKFANQALIARLGRRAAPSALTTRPDRSRRLLEALAAPFAAIAGFFPLAGNATRSHRPSFFKDPEP